MRKRLLQQLPVELPQELRQFVARAKVYDSSCSPEAKVYFIDQGEGYYLKYAGRGMLGKEAGMAGYFHARGLGPEVICYLSDDHDWLLTMAAAGEDCLHENYLSQPQRLCDTIAYALRRLHEMDHSGCPVPDRTAEYLAAAENNYHTGNDDRSLFPHSFGYRSAEEAHMVLMRYRDTLQDRVLLHGDYCLPNILLDNWKFSAFIDVGRGGVGDRHIDIFWGAWTLWFNLKTNRYRERFLDAYGRDEVELEKLRVIAAAEVFG